MKNLPYIISGISLVITLVTGLVAFFKGNSKEQQIRDREQDEKIHKIANRLTSLEGRVYTNESLLSVFDSKFAKEIEKLEKKLDDLYSLITTKLK